MRKVGSWWGLSPFIGALQSCFRCCWETENLKSSWHCGHMLYSSHPPPYPILHWPALENSHGVEVEYCLWKQEDLSWSPAPAGHYCIDRGHLLSPISSSEKYTSPCYNVGLLWRLKEIWYLVSLVQNERWLFFSTCCIAQLEGLAIDTAVCADATPGVAYTSLTWTDRASNNF